MTIKTLKLMALIAIIATMAFAADNELTQREKDQGFKLLFDGKSLNGWKATGRAEAWGIEDGAIARVGSGGGYLYTTEKFENFVLRLDYKIEPHANSGVFLRWSDLNDVLNTGIEMQILDSHAKEKPGKHDDGAIYDIAAPTKIMSKPAGEWNRAVIRCEGPMITVRLNGEKVCEINVDQWTVAGRNPDGTPNKFRYAYKELPRKGHIAFQDHGHKVWFKNIRIRELKQK